MPKQFADYSAEDARLFVWNDQPWMSCTVSQYPATVFRCVVIYARLEIDDSGARVVEWYRPNYGQNDFTTTEKNWCPWVCSGKLWFYYATSGETNTFIRVEKEKVVETVKAKIPAWNYGPIHGGCIVETPDGPLFFFNSRTGDNKTRDHRYYIGCARLDARTFEATAISRMPILYGEEGVCTQPIKHWKNNVVFTCGGIWQDGRVHLAHGWNDCESRIAKLKPEHLKL